MRLSIGERQLPQVHGSKYCPAQWSPASVWGHPVAAQIAMLDTVASQQQRSSYSSTFFPLTSSRMPPTHTTNTEKDTISQSPAKPETTVNSSSGCQLLGRWVMWARHQWPAFPCRWPTHFSPQDQRLWQTLLAWLERTAMGVLGIKWAGGRCEKLLFIYLLILPPSWFC